MTWIEDLREYQATYNHALDEVMELFPTMEPWGRRCGTPAPYTFRVPEMPLMDAARKATYRNLYLMPDLIGRGHNPMPQVMSLDQVKLGYKFLYFHTWQHGNYKESFEIHLGEGEKWLKDIDLDSWCEVIGTNGIHDIRNQVRNWKELMRKLREVSIP